MFHQHHQFGAISFYSHTTSTATPGKSSPGNTLQHKRIMTNGSLPRDKTKFLFESSTPENSDPAPTPRVVQSPRTKIKTTCSYTINRPPVPVRKPLVFPNSG